MVRKCIYLPSAMAQYLNRFIDMTIELAEIDDSTSEFLLLLHMYVLNIMSAKEGVSKTQLRYS
jgi:hypothetical protein